MSTLHSLLRSVVISGIFSFVLPCTVIGILASGLYFVGIYPSFAQWSQGGLQALAYILCTFGNGDLVTGLMLIGCVCSLVGILFDVFAFYRQQKLGNN